MRFQRSTDSELAQVFQPIDPQAESEALETIQALLKTIYADDVSNTSSEDIQGLARDASEECVEILKEPEKSQARPATKILCAFMSTTRTNNLSLHNSV